MIEQLTHHGVDDESVGTGDTRGWKFTVPSGAPDLKVMVSWTDPASTPAASSNLVNDIDFAVKIQTETGLNMETI